MPPRLAFPFRLALGAAGEQAAEGAAVVAGKDDQRLVPQLLFLQRGHDAADLVVQGGDHGRIGAPLLIFDRFVAVEVFLGRLVRGVGCERGDVKEKRLLPILGLDQLHRLVPDQGRVIALLFQERAVALPVDDSAALSGKVVYFAHHVAVEVVEPAVLRPVLPVGMPEVPLAHHQGPVARLFQRLWQRAFLGRQAVGVAGEDDQRLQAVSHGIAPGHKGGTGWGADVLPVKGLQSHAPAGQAVDVRRLDVASPVAEVRIAQVVRHDEHNVGLFSLGKHSGLGQTKKGQDRHAEN
jgi:hypothetical protein